jgi:hypothetical protein
LSVELAPQTRFFQRKVLNSIEILEGMGGFHNTVIEVFLFIFGAYSLAGFKLEILQRAYKKRKNDKLTLS